MAGKLRISELMIGAGSLALLVSTLFPWFSLPSGGELVTSVPGTHLVGPAHDRSIDLNVWDLPLARWWVYLTILLGICVLLAALLSESPDWATILLTPLVLASIFAVIALMFRLIDSPRPYSSAQFGFFLGLAAAVLTLAGTLWALRDESVPDGFAKAPRPEQIEVE